MTEMHCAQCGKKPSEIGEYVSMAEEEGIPADKWVMQNEGTYNRNNGLFVCTDCYIKIGMPSSPRGYKPLIDVSKLRKTEL